MDTTTQGEVYLGAWSDAVESSVGRTDAWIKLYLSDSEMLNDLRSQDVRGKAKEGGKRYMLVMVEIGDDEQPVQKAKHMTKLSNVAGVMCERDSLIFGSWFKEQLPAQYEACVSTYGNGWKDLKPNQRCRELIVYACSIDSRSQLDTDQDAAKEFKEHISEPFDQYCQQMQT